VEKIVGLSFVIFTLIILGRIVKYPYLVDLVVKGFRAIFIYVENVKETKFWVGI
jgi:hypothetical protein